MHRKKKKARKKVLSPKSAQRQVYERLHSFKTKLTEAATFPTEISDILFIFSGHQQILGLWISIFHKLRQFSVGINPGCTIEEIARFEQNCKHILPSDIRVSLMISNFGINLPPIFTDSTPFECCVSPLSSWKILNGHNFFDEDYFVENDNDPSNIYKQWFADNKMIRIGEYGNDKWGFHSQKVRVYLNIETGEMLMIDVWTEDKTKEIIFKDYKSFQDFFEINCIHQINDRSKLYNFNDFNTSLFNPCPEDDSDEEQEDFVVAVENELNDMDQCNPKNKTFIKIISEMCTVKDAYRESMFHSQMMAMYASNDFSTHDHCEFLYGPDRTKRPERKLFRHFSEETSTVTVQRKRNQSNE